MALKSDKRQADWAPQSGFVAQAEDQGAASYFGHKNNGYQSFRHARLATMLDPIQATLGRAATVIPPYTGATDN